MPGGICTRQEMAPFRGAHRGRGLAGKNQAPAVGDHSRIPLLALTCGRHGTSRPHLHAVISEEWAATLLYEVPHPGRKFPGHKPEADAVRSIGFAGAGPRPRPMRRPGLVQRPNRPAPRPPHGGARDRHALYSRHPEPSGERFPPRGEPAMPASVSLGAVAPRCGASDAFARVPPFRPLRHTRSLPVTMPAPVHLITVGPSLPAAPRPGAGSRRAG